MWPGAGQDTSDGSTTPRDALGYTDEDTLPREIHLQMGDRS